MQRIPIAQAAPDMVLDQPVMRPDKPEGLAVFGRGIKLTQTNIDRLKQIGVQSISVEGHPVEIEGEETMETVLKNMEHRFRHVKDHPEMMLILELFSKQIKKNYQ